jgi:hypothetical protein
LGSIGAWESFIDSLTDPSPMHQLGGHPQLDQYPNPPDGYRLFAQIESDPLTGSAFGDGGRLHIWSPEHSMLLGALGYCTVDLDFT